MAQPNRRGTRHLSLEVARVAAREGKGGGGGREGLEGGGAEGFLRPPSPPGAHRPGLEDKAFSGTLAAWQRRSGSATTSPATR